MMDLLFQDDEYEVRREEDGITLYLDAPGASDSSTDIEFANNELRVSYEKHRGDRKKSVVRRFALSKDAFDHDAATAKLSNGMLTIRLPVSQSRRKRKIPLSA